MNYRSTHRGIAKRLALLTASATLFVAGASFAAAPTTSLIEGVMTSSGGGAAADGTYDVTFSLWEAQSGGTAAWSEGPVKVAVKGGQFSYALGSTKALDIKKVAALKAQWLGMKIGADPALTRQKVHASLFARWAGSAGALTCTGCVTAGHLANNSISAAKMGFNYAGSATKGGAASDLNCTGCVSVKEMKFDGNADFGAFSVMAKSFIGDGSKLTGLLLPKGECLKPGEVVKGINADGTLKCVAALDPAALPADGIDEISNGLISNQFTDTIAATGTKVAIPDNQGTDAVWNLNFPDIGKAQSFDINVKVENTDLSTISIALLPPDDKKTGWVLCDPCGKKDAKKYDVIFTQKNPPQTQKGAGKKIADWIGQNPKGLWTLKVKDTQFCVPQAPGNSTYCNPTAKTDGWISSFSIKLKTLSNGKLSQNGDVYISGTLWGKDQGHGKPGGALQVGGDLYVKGQKVQLDGQFPIGSRPYLFGYTEDKLNSSYMNDSFYSFATQVPTDLRSLHNVAPNIIWGDKEGNVRRQRGGPNYGNGSSDRSSGYLVAFIKNTTAKAIVHKVCFYYSGYNGNYTGLAINKSNVWQSTSNVSGATCQNMTIPANKSSVVVLKSGSRYYTNWNGQYTRMMIGFYNDTWKLPVGIEWDYEAYHNWTANNY